MYAFAPGTCTLACRYHVLNKLHRMQYGLLCTPQTIIKKVTIGSQRMGKDERDLRETALLHPDVGGRGQNALPEPGNSNLLTWPCPLSPSLEGIQVLGSSAASTTVEHSVGQGACKSLQFRILQATKGLPNATDITSTGNQSTQH